MAHRIDAMLAKHQRPGFGDMLQAIEIAVERNWIVQIDIRTVKIDAGRVEELSRRIIAISKQALRRLLFGNLQQLLDEALDLARPIESDHIVRNLIADANGKNRRMRAELGGGVANSIDRVLLR